MKTCKDCIHFETCDAWEQNNGVPKIDAALCGYYAVSLADKLKAEITAALESNYRAKAERLKNPDLFSGDFVAYCDGKIHALRGLLDFIEELEKKHAGKMR